MASDKNNCAKYKVVSSCMDTFPMYFISANVALFLVVQINGNSFILFFFIWKKADNVCFKNSFLIKFKRKNHTKKII